MLSASGNLILRWLLPIGLLFAACKSPTEPTVYPPFELKGDVISYIRDGALWAVELESGKTQMITDDLEFKRYRWSLDGKYIALDRHIEGISDGGYYIAIIEPTGEEVLRIESAVLPHWSAGGDSILHSLDLGIAGFGGTAISILDLSGGSYQSRSTSIPNSAGIMAYSAIDNVVLIHAPLDSSNLYEADISFAYLFDLVTEESRLLIDPDTAFVMRSGRFSPDGTQIAFRAISLERDNRAEQVVDIFLIDATGQNLRSIHQFASVHGSVTSFAWSPNGQKILYYNRVPGESRGWVVALNIAAGTIENVIEGAYPEWTFVE